MKWEYISQIKESTGYEDVLDQLNFFSKEKYMASLENEKQKMIDQVFEIYRKKNIFPITYYNEDGIIDEIKQCIEKNISWNGEILNIKLPQGNNLIRFLFPNIFDIIIANDKRTMNKKFHDDKLLKRAIKFAFDYKENVLPNKIRTALELAGGSCGTNFNTMKAKAIYERYCPKNGIIYDFSCGFGGRMLGALSSKNNYKYFGVEPNEETYNNLNKLGKYIEKTSNKEKIFKIYKQGSEDYFAKDEYCDFIFSSPPYFNLEKYSEENSQCYNKFSTLESWFEGYVIPTIENCYRMSKKDSFYAINIADFNMGGKRIEFVKKWQNLLANSGYKFIKNIPMKLTKRRGEHWENKNEVSEGIFIFQK
jgi:16S rRNA G966 N2-methylase RsmD